MGRPFGLDAGAIMTIGAALQTDAELLADVLPEAEAAIIRRYLPDDEGGTDE
ncbi:DUF7697 family protein [Sphingomonas sp. Leaf22]|uniref:DUF7697 family protein n=1 Tax=Sphingomonas sp. Leaf22 TaxID=1735687 RepID=UPI0012E1C891|nr:hypothetical protein [Sphingomonas sp. Leaf22]